MGGGVKPSPAHPKHVEKMGGLVDSRPCIKLHVPLVYGPTTKSIRAEGWCSHSHENKRYGTAQNLIDTSTNSKQTYVRLRDIAR